MKQIRAGCRYLLFVTFTWNCSASAEIDPQTGLVLAPHYELVDQNCTACHSSKLIIQNRADREGWLAMIRWMQEKQGLWPLGTDEAKILDYLTANYGLTTSAYRRKPLARHLMPPP